jgi:two-component system sensor histidine kinase/response regulator
MGCNWASIIDSFVIIFNQWIKTRTMTKILVIEDEDDIRDIIIQLLEAHDFQVIDAEDGETGVKLAIQHHPDLIICDMMMPGLDGYGVLRELHNHPSTHTIPFIVLTAKAGKEDMRLAMELGADDYLTKPFTASELLGAVKIRLEKKELFQQQSDKKLNELRHNLTRSLPHELLTPLNGILGFAKLLSDNADSIKPDEIKEMAEMIDSSSHRLHTMIQNFLLYAQLEIFSHDPKRLQIFLEGETGGTQVILRSVAQKKAEEFNRMADLSLNLQNIPLPIAEHWFNKMAKELIDNAFKFSHPGTPVEVNTTVTGNHFILSVCDRGRGMTAEQIANVGAYVQFERKIYEQQGSGLGLSITKRFTKLYGGRLMIDSIPLKQTKVRMILPLQKKISSQHSDLSRQPST